MESRVFKPYRFTSRRHALQRLMATLGALVPTAQAAARGANGQSATADMDRVHRGRVLQFPRDHGAHLNSRIEWWYATGWLGTEQTPTHGFQLTFFRSATGLAGHVGGRFAARHLLFAHAAVTTLPQGGSPGQHRHDQRLARWSGEPDSRLASAGLSDARLQLGDWWLRREAEDPARNLPAHWRARLPADGFTLDVELSRTQPLLLQGDRGFSRKGPAPESAGADRPADPDRHASHYYSEPQLQAQLQLAVTGQARAAGTGRAWMDHEWSDALLHPQAVGWDWLGINLFDGSALTAFVLRRADGSLLWAGGSYRTADGQKQVLFGAQDVQMQALRRWRSPVSGGHYPVQWQLRCPAGNFELSALLDAQELDGRAGTGAVYWEGLSELTDSNGQRVGLGYLEMTGYTGPLTLG